MRINTSFENLNGISENKRYNHPFLEEKWITPENKSRLINSEALSEKDGFHFSITNEDLMLWNGKERTYLPFLGVGMKIDDYVSDMVSQVENKKQIFKQRFPTIFEKLSLLKMSEDQIIDMIFPYIIEYRNVGKSTRTLYIEGDIENGEIVSISLSNYLRCNVGKNSHLLNYYYEETSDKKMIPILLKGFLVKGYELLHFEDKSKN